MDDIIVRALRGQATSEEVSALAAWRAEGPANEQRYRDIAELWEASAARGPIIPRPSAEAIVRRAGRPRRWWSGALAAAAALAMALGGWWTLWVADGGWTRYEAIDAPVTLTLADGSFVRLAPGGELSVRVDAADRNVRLTGRAFFAVAHDASAPFRVEAGSGEVEVLGTRFEASADDDTLAVAVIDGRVALRNGAGAVDVERGQLGHAVRGRAPAVWAVGDVFAVTATRRPVFLYQDSPLADVVAELEAEFGRAAVIADSALGARGVTARFDAESFEEILQILCDITGARCDLAAVPARISP